MAKHGVIYILNNKIRDGENVFKVGETYDPDRRLADLNNETSNIGEFKKVAVFPVSDTVRAEKECFKELARFRIQDNREFFRGSQSEIISIVKNVASKYKPVEESPDDSDGYWERWERYTRSEHFYLPSEAGAIFIWTEYNGEKGVLDVFCWGGWEDDPAWIQEDDSSWQGDDPDNMICEQFAKFYVSCVTGVMLQCEKELEPYWTDDYKPLTPDSSASDKRVYGLVSVNEYINPENEYIIHPERVQVKQSYQNEIIKIVAKVASNYAVENKPPDLKHKFLKNEA